MSLGLLNDIIFLVFLYSSIAMLVTERLTRSTAAARQGRPAAIGRELLHLVKNPDQA
tara:strand:- start:2055 stop:2225 length:171 start_codon:yes stop_codon:yes gene_type:complete